MNAYSMETDVDPTEIRLSTASYNIRMTNFTMLPKISARNAN